jgi:flagellar hook protein FlgE
MSFQQGLSGLNAASKGLDVVGNNVANASSVGFKSSSAHFADVYANSLGGAGGSNIGIGTKLAAVVQQFSQGNITATENPLDLAINGGGFFRLSDSGTINYTRNGQFQVDKDGYLVTVQGQRVTGYGADANGNIVASAPVDIQLSTADLPPRDTSAINALLNLDSRLNPPTTAVFSPTDATSFNNSTSLSIYDTLGNAHVMSYYFIKTAVPNGWEIYATVDGTSENNVDLGAGAGNPVTMTFDTSGQLTTAMPYNVSVDLNQVAIDLGQVNGANTPLNFTSDFSGTSQFGAPFGVNTLAQDGFTSGRLSGLAVTSDGVISGRYTNGQTRDLGQVVLADFPNANGLKPIGDTQWVETAQSGPALVSTAGSGTLGLLQPSAVENANVDLTAELVDMITLQRMYQANAQTIKTQDALLQTLVNLR